MEAPDSVIEEIQANLVSAKEQMQNGLDIWNQTIKDGGNLLNCSKSLYYSQGCVASLTKVLRLLAGEDDGF